MKHTRFEVIVVVVCILVACAVICIGFTLFKRQPDTIGPGADATESVSDNSVSENTVTTPTTEPVHEQPEVLEDPYDLNKRLFDYTVDEFDCELLTWSVNSMLESTGADVLVEDSALEVCMSNILEHQQDGMVYLVVHYDGGTEATVDVCAYADRINPLYQVVLTCVDGTWEIAY